MIEPELQNAYRNINLLADALEKIETRGCMFAAAGSGAFQCAHQNERELCSGCIAHEALETFRGQ